MWVSSRTSLQVIRHVGYFLLDFSVEGSRRICAERQVNAPVDTGAPLKQRKIRSHDRLAFLGLQDCIKNKDLIQGQILYSLIVLRGQESEAVLGSYLIRFFVSFDKLQEANYVFGKLHDPNVYAWSEIILVNSKHGQSERAISLYEKMCRTCSKLDKYVFVAGLKACASAGALTEGKLILTHVIETGIESDIFVRSIVIDVYVKCACLDDARSIFDKAKNKDVVIWNAMIAGYAFHGHCWEAVELLQKMQQKGPVPNDRTWTAILSGYAQHGKGQDTFQFFEQMLYEGIEPGVVTWNVMISGYALQGEGQQALYFLHCMMREGGKPNRITLLCSIKACASIADVRYGKLVHFLLIDCGFDTGLAVRTTLIDMYGKCAFLEEAQKVFEGITNPDAASYNALIAGYALYGHGLIALKLFERMQKEGMMPNDSTVLSILKVCSFSAALNKGKLIHSFMVESGIDVDEFAGSSLIDMYARCGSLEDACRVLHNSSNPNSVSWNALIAGYVLYSDYQEVCQQLKDMQANGVVPDEVTFLSLMAACSYLGLVKEGSYLLNTMLEYYGVSPEDEHYGCMVDILGRAGHLIEAEDLLFAMPYNPDIVPWTSLLNNCRIYNYLELGERCFENVVAIDETCASAYALMSIIYAASGMSDDAGILKEMREQSNAWKKPGKAFIELDNEVHGFVVRDMVHPHSDSLYVKLQLLTLRLKKGGYVYHI